MKKYGFLYARWSLLISLLLSGNIHCMEAIETDETDMIELQKKIFSSGKDFNAKNLPKNIADLLQQRMISGFYKGMTPLHIAVYLNKPQAITTMLGAAENLENVLQAKIIGSKKFYEGLTPLQLAAYLGDETAQAAKALLNNAGGSRELIINQPSDAKIPTYRGKSALSIAQKKQHIQIQEVLTSKPKEDTTLQILQQLLQQLKNKLTQLLLEVTKLSRT